jgi:O-antigen ligase
MAGLGIAAIFALALAIYNGWRAEWGTIGQSLANAYQRLNQKQQMILTFLTAAIVALTGWLTWGQQAAGLYRRLGDGEQLVLTAAVASLFYIAPSFFVYTISLIILFLLIYFRPAWGIALIAFFIPFYVEYKPILNYRFSPVEVFTLITFVAFCLSQVTSFLANRSLKIAGNNFFSPHIWFQKLRSSLHLADYAVITFTIVATLSLLFTERLDVATNEWRVVIFEPGLFYFLLRGARLNKREMYGVLDAFILGGLLVALIGLWRYGTGQDLITAEGGLARLRSIYGSPNNVALYLGRIFPILTAMTLLGTPGNGRRRWAYALSLLPIGMAILLSFSKGALFLGLPAAMLFIFWRWQRMAGRRTWPWLIGFIILGFAGIMLTQQIPQLAGRFDLRGATGVFRVNLWKATLNMIADHPLFGVGLDNFLYAYRGRYIFDAAWQEPDLNHPHNILLDFGSRLGILGLLAGSWMTWMAVRTIRQVLNRSATIWLPVTVGLGAALIDMLAHGLVDHSFFLVDLAFAFYLLLGLVVWLERDIESKPSLVSDS